MTMAAWIAIFALVLASVLLADADDAHGAVKFGYSGSNGPDNWGSLCPDYQMCSKGVHQSPVNIDKRELAYYPGLEALERNYVPTNATLVNKGYQVVLLFDNNVGTVLVDGKNYSLKSVHWHSPSEHTIDGKRKIPTGKESYAVELLLRLSGNTSEEWTKSYFHNPFFYPIELEGLDKEQETKFPIELHMVHKGDNGKIAAVAILYQIGRHDPFVNQIERKLKELAKEACKGDKEAHIPVGVVHTRSLKLHSTKYYRYFGSLTTPPCTENVIWSILGRVREMTKEQVAALQAPLSQECRKNSRPTQPLNYRAVQLYLEPRKHDENSR